MTDLRDLCEHGVIGCSLCWDTFSPEKKAWHLGASHKGYGWTPRPRGDYTPAELEAYEAGYRNGVRLQYQPVGTRVRTDHGTGVVEKYEVLDDSGISETIDRYHPGAYRLMIRLDPGHTWQTTRPELLYCEFPNKVETLTED